MWGVAMLPTAVPAQAKDDILRPGQHYFPDGYILISEEGPWEGKVPRKAIMWTRRTRKSQKVDIIWGANDVFPTEGTPHNRTYHDIETLGCPVFDY